LLPPDSANGDHVLLAPPFIASRVELDTMVERVASAIDAAGHGDEAGGLAAVGVCGWRLTLGLNRIN
jgi:hypothetical protein